ncbi:hypothetical protein DYH09_26810 [bacterium CPR1]|nr:hypothetical protein [bacterium CPR1]
MRISLLLLAALTVLALSPAQAQPVNERERNQANRIYNGVSSGQLTRAETANASRDLARIQRRESYYRATGGRYTAAERRATQHQLNRSSRQIYRLKHNAR